MADFQQDIFGGQVEVQDLSQPSPWQGEGGHASAGEVYKNTFNIFALTDAVASRDKRHGWMIYQQALASGMAADEIFWRVMWIVKSMLLASKTKSFAETDMKEFPYNKAKGALKNWKKGELEKLSESLVVGYHNARRGIGDMETMLEKIILSL